MMFSFFKEMWEAPLSQEGQKIKSKPDEKPSEVDEDGQVTEEGFVRVDRSSFLFSSTTYPNPNQNTLYPLLNSSGIPIETEKSHSTGATNYYQGYGQALPSLDNQDIIRSLPFALHPDLKPHISLYDPKPIERILNYEARLDISQFNYDFDFERGVLRDINQQIEMKKYYGQQHLEKQRESWVKF